MEYYNTHTLNWDEVIKQKQIIMEKQMKLFEEIYLEERRSIIKSYYENKNNRINVYLMIKEYK